MSKTIIFIPTLNEEKAIGELVTQVKKQGFKDVVVVDSDSDDMTREIAGKAGAKVLNIKGRGKGRGFQFFQSNWKIEDNCKYIMLDGDLSYDPKYLKQISQLLDNYDIVAGWRKLAVYNPKDLLHIIGNKIISLIGSALYLNYNQDICTGYWGFKGSALKKLKIDALKFDLEANIFAQAIKKKLSFGHIWVDYKKRVGEAKLKTMDALFIISKLFKERFN